jgi:glycerol kinase|tara:strand:- start:1266 stop:1433 length:168 start_codon:yes stop_codon:yes gene_type:complete
MEVARSVCAETNAIGVAYLAGLQTNICASLGELTQTWQSKQISLKTEKQYLGSRV